MTEISVAIATRERPDMLDRCLSSLLAGAAPVRPAEIVVVDQSPGEQTAQVVERHQAAYEGLVYVHQAGQGLAKAQNLAISRAHGEVVAVTDDDCVPTPEWLPAIAAGLAEPGGVDALTGPVLPYGPPRPGTAPVSSRTSTVRVDFGRRAMPWDIGSGNNFAVRRAWLERLGGNDERLGPGSPGRGGVDMDLFYRLVRAGARIRYEPAALVYHERASLASRMARRGPYGYGMGACCGLWLRQGDRNALRVLGRWLTWRAGRLASGLLHGDGLRAQEEAQVLAGTVSGWFYGLRVGGQTPAHRLANHLPLQP